MKNIYGGFDKIKDGKVFFYKGNFPSNIEIFSVDISEIKYIVIHRTQLRYGRLNQVELNRSGQLKPSMIFMKELAYGMYGYCDKSLLYCDRNEVLFSTYYHVNLLKEVMREGFQGEIHILREIYNDMQEEWTQLARKELIDFSRVVLFE